MNGSGCFPQRSLLWVGMVLLVILAGVGLVFFNKMLPQKGPLTFFFAGWTNDARGARVAVLCVSNRSDEAVMYLADHKRTPRCELISVLAHRQEGNHRHIVYTNLAAHLWNGHLRAELPPGSAVYCLLPWRDEYTNGTARLSYFPKPGFIERISQNVSLIFKRPNVQIWQSVPLTGAPWTNSGVRPF